MAALIRPANVFFKGKKVADVQEGDFEIASGDQAEVGSEGYIGHTDGATMSKLNATMIVPFGGLSINTLTTMLNKQYVRIALAEDGKIFDIVMRTISIRYTWNHKAGENRCQASWEGGEPEVTG